VTQRNGAIATPHHLATEAGELAYRDGGNAIDAALAAATVLQVVYPHNTALGGDLVALVRAPDGVITCVNATGTAPSARRVEELRARHGDVLPTRGPDTITVPGAVAGWQAIRARGAALGWADQFSAAIGYAADGVPVARSLAAALLVEAPDLALDPGCRAVFAPQGDWLPEGAPLVQPALADSLRGLAAHGPEYLYRGRLGAALVSGLRALGVPITTEDLAGYTARITGAISVPFGGHEVHTSPPNTQGFLLLRTLRALTALGLDLSAPADVVAGLFVDGNRVRDTLLADPGFAVTDLDDGLADVLARLRSGRRGVSGVDTGIVAPQARGDTVGIAAADSGGYAVSLIQSVFYGFGAAVLEPGTGILMQNRGMSFSLDPGSPNVIAPGKRPRHTLMPVLVTSGPDVRWVNSTMGGRVQPQIHAHLLRHLLAGATPEQAVSAPRWAVTELLAGDSPNTVRHEPGLPATTVAELAVAGPVVELPPRSEHMGHANVVSIAPDGTLTAGSDPRSDGSARVVALP
jgi:gamma-glutamyltranspeptidase/glutathione hydrolase